MKNFKIIDHMGLTKPTTKYNLAIVYGLVLLATVIVFAVATDGNITNVEPWNI